MPIDKRTGKPYPAEEGVGDKTEQLPGMLDPISQAKADKKKKEPQPQQPTKPKAYKKGGSVSRGDGICRKGHTKGKMV